MTTKDQDMSEIAEFKDWYDAVWLGDQEHGQEVPTNPSHPQFKEYMDGYTVALGAWQAARAPMLARIAELEADAERYRAINTPEIENFLQAVHNEALHQRERWGSEHDAGKTDADWFWLIGYLAGKAIRPDATAEKQLHHIITTAAALLNWHAAKVGTHNRMRPGIDAAIRGNE